MKVKQSNLPASFIFGLVAAILGISALYLVVRTDFSKAIALPSLFIVWGTIAYTSVKLDYWKTLGVWLLVFTITEGFLGDVPRLVILNETIRNLYFHVTMWFAMLFLLLASVIYSIMYLVKEDLKWDVFAMGASEGGTVMGIIGLVTGMIWARYTWGSWWHWDPKQLYTAIGLLLYLAYFILRGSFDDDTTRARIASVINIFAFPSLIALLYILPRMMTSTHPGQEGNPAFSDYDLNDNMRLVFYPAIIGFTLVATWIASIRIRTRLLELKFIDSSLKDTNSVRSSEGSIIEES